MAERVSIRGDHGELTLDEPVEGVFVGTYRGVGHASFVPPILELVNRRVRQGLKITMCVDASELQSYESDFRRGWTDWMSANRARCYPVAILFRSKIVQMGISLVNPLIGNIIVPMFKREEFDAFIAAAVQRAKSQVGTTRP